MILGVGFMVHGWAKWNRGPAAFAELLKQAHVPLPLVNAWLVTLLEIFGGLALLMGAFVALVSIPLIFSMLGAMFTVNIKYGFSAVNTIGLTPEGPQLGPPGYAIRQRVTACLILRWPLQTVDLFCHPACKHRHSPCPNNRGSKRDHRTATAQSECVLNVARNPKRQRP